MVFAYSTPAVAVRGVIALTPVRAGCECIQSIRTGEGAMGSTSRPPAPGGQLGERRLGTMAAVAQALAIGPMFSTALVLSLVSNPANGSTFNTALSVLVAGLGVLAIAYAISLFARRYQGAGAVYEYL